MLFIRQRNVTSHMPGDLFCHAVIADAEQEPFLCRTRQVDHGKLAFPRLAEPALLGKFLDVAGPVSFGVVPVQGEEDPGAQQQQWQDDNPSQDRHPA